ncbi:hypothetical protein BKA69DRAFT_1041790 [Paraphysoderma sedebokerense]|nr:hypothetical protein BKA69DRAFT_1041790 [Paraphysoderma sedebokerense]
MSNFYGAKTSDTSFRRTWDKSKYGSSASSEPPPPPSEKPKSSKPPVDAAELQFLESRKAKLKLESMVGKTQVVQVAATSNASATPGFYCSVCDCVLKDSVNYLDHINGRRHQQALGISLKVKRSTVDDVKSRLDALKRKKEDVAKEYDLDARVELLKQQELEAKRRKRENKKRKKQNGYSRRAPSDEEDNDERSDDNDEEENGKRRRTADSDEGREQNGRTSKRDFDDEADVNEEDEMAQLMGFGGFGSSKK